MLDLGTYAATWPRWNVYLLAGLIALALFLKHTHHRLRKNDNHHDNISNDSTIIFGGMTITASSYNKSSFLSFQRTYLLVFYVTQLADWLQGPTMYELYLEYTSDQKFQVSDAPLQRCMSSGDAGSCHPAQWGPAFIGTLFITGFATSSIASMFVGPLIDTYGRRLSCIIYCVLEIIINTMEHSVDMRVLLFGRFLGGTQRTAFVMLQLYSFKSS